MPQAIERLRDRLRDLVPAGSTVSDERTTYYFDEDSAAFCDIAVRTVRPAGDRGFALVVLTDPGSAVRTRFMAGVWYDYVPEVWVVDEEGGSVTRLLSDGTAESHDSRRPLALPWSPGTTIPVGPLFA